ncbi:MAG: hypothetical protein ABJB69_02335 [Spartobacteria bacterium]
MKRPQSTIDFSRYALAAAALGTVSAVKTADADFIPPYALNPPPNATYSGAAANGVFGNWTSSLTFVPSSDSLVTNQPTSVSLNIQNFTFPATTDNFDLVTTAAGSGTVSFDWSLSGTGFGPLTFGYLVNGSFTQLGQVTSTGQSSSSSFAVSAGDTFGFRLIANYGGSGGVTISNFAAPIPEPSITMLAVTGAVGLLALRAVRRRRVS